MLNPHANPAELTVWSPLQVTKGQIREVKDLPRLTHIWDRSCIMNPKALSSLPSILLLSLCAFLISPPLCGSQALGAPVSVQPSKSFTQQRWTAVSLLASAITTDLQDSVPPWLPISWIWSVWSHLACFPKKGHEEDGRASADQGLKHKTKAKSRHKGAGEAGSVWKYNAQCAQGLGRWVLRLLLFGKQFHSMHQELCLIHIHTWGQHPVFTTLQLVFLNLKFKAIIFLKGV